ncbi:lipopolysaccharide export system permease protein [Selenomonas sp. WCT3]|uniref:LPS export ABC transporter permease LptG n=1 Tax=unclassified Selenomonas TaxID=2637378 RepID=UPI00051BBB4A|nr:MULTISPECIES: LPS export ABC transporter permease LptG [unclassified Selenomonas]MCR5440135.1 LPS export ABC transporter permease LptG [Selenomonas sp.]SDG12968.1 lipopolysaccharide export system permease protein [Selenomonas ruminantium]
MHIRILDKYIFREVFMTFLFGICAFSAVFIGSGTLFKIAKYITDYGASLQAVVKIFIFGLPAVIMWTFPMSMLLASLLTFGRLSSSSEITAMKSCGIGFGRIAAPAILMGLIVSMCAIAFNEYVVPWANTAYRNVLYYEIQGNTGMKSQEHIILKDLNHDKIQRLVYARRYDAESQTLQGITLQEFNDEGQVSHVENAEYAEWSGNEWNMHNGMIYDIATEAGKSEHTMRFDSQKLPIKANPKQIVREQKDPEELTMKELKAQIEIMKTQYINTNKLEAELYQRVTVPMASLIFALIGVPLGLQPTRNSSSAGFAMSVIIIFFYYALMTMGNALARSGAIAPMLAVWIPNIVGLIAGFFLIRRASR